MKLKEDFVVHDHLNEKLFSKNNQLLPEVRAKIIQIVDKFEEFSEVPLNILDIQLVGSNASYNYTDTSDLDVHIINAVVDIFDLLGRQIHLFQQGVQIGGLDHAFLLALGDERLQGCLQLLHIGLGCFLCVAHWSIPLFILLMHVKMLCC